MRVFLLFSLVMIMILACQDTAKSEAKSKKPETETASEDKTSDKNIRNQIEINSEGVTIRQAFLMFEDGKLVPDDNMVEVGQKVLLRLILKGWKEEDGKVFLGASEKITTDEGQVLLDEQNLFASYASGVDPKEAEMITLTAVITRVDRLYKYFKVSFRVWDDKSTDNVSGYYQLYLK